MCGIFGYSSKTENNAFKVIHKGLERLEYRGYDSWGISILENGIIKTYKTTNNLTKKPGGTLPKAKIGIGHTRWATHGRVTQNNAHPHYSSDKSFVLAQNGIVENFLDLKAFLKKKGFEFSTQTDTEVIVKLIEHFQKSTADMEKAIIEAFKKLKGRNTIILLTIDGTVMAIKNGSPLTLGVKDGSIFFSSDTLSFSNHTNKTIILDDYEMIIYKNQKLKFIDLNTKKVIHKDVIELDFEDQTIDKQGFDYFMLKEIMEQPNAIKSATNYSLEELKPTLKLIKNSKKIFTTGAGTASFAAGQTAYYLRNVAHVNAVNIKSYEVLDYENIFDDSSTLIVFSQSGETADTLEALELAKQKGVKIISLVNMMGSTISRKSDLECYLRVGPEICVVSTKAFAGMITWGYLVAKSLIGDYSQTQNEIKTATRNLTNMLDDKLFEDVEKLAATLISKNKIFVLGKGQNYFIAKEGALKMKEAAYKHAEAFSAGELKHGVIALIEKGVPVICVVSEDDQKSKMLNAAEEVKARGGTIIGIAKNNEDAFDHFVKTKNLEEIDALSKLIPFQLLAYFMSVEQGFNPDKPRNLAKSVTVS